MMYFEFPITPWPLATNKWTGKQEDVKTYKVRLKELAKAAMRGKKPTEKILEVTIKVYVLPPKWIVASQIKSAKCELGVIRPDVKPDVKDYIESILEAMNKIIWRDDALIVKLIAEKFYSKNPRVEMEVRELEDMLFV